MKARCTKCGEMFEQKTQQRQCGCCKSRITITIDKLTLKKIQNVKADYILEHKKDVSSSGIVSMLIKESPKIARQSDVKVGKSS